MQSARLWRGGCISGDGIMFCSQWKCKQLIAFREGGADCAVAFCGGCDGVYTDEAIAFAVIA